MIRVSEPAMALGWLDGEIAVLGLARSGRAVGGLLVRTGASVYASDVGSSPALEAAATALRADGASVDVGRHDLERVARASLVVTSPGVPPDAPPLAVARAHGIPVVSEMEIGLRFLPALRYIAVTGTNGKTTTTALTAHLLRTLGLRAEAAGNIGRPLTELAAAPDPAPWVALEVSSFQLHDTPAIAPDVGILTNLSANHLDRYASVDAYYADKAFLFQNATTAASWVTNRDDDACQALVRDVAGVHADFSVAQRADAYYDRVGDRLVVLGEPLIARRELPLVGDHNVANALSAVLAVMLADSAHRAPQAVAQLAAGLRAFRPLEHRIEPAGASGGVAWINDSKSTNVMSTLVALRGMTRPTVLLLGGRHKGEPYTALADELRRTVKRVIAYGEAAPLIVQDLERLVPVTRVPAGASFADVVAQARAAAEPGDVVLLSPACSSYDMFDNYEQRGAEFKRLAVAR
ncbi:MAG: UDP-N-acetylmuramoyl-L-alanine--D-glutamate ligase [Gemmatimonadetes bacterium 21-71-4]|nr:MAG: UDP-N-acetylmuramoyl-L-alanine--D-glutamate ligase [Gemmatimonadetes bacterium 21-71-4]